MTRLHTGTIPTSTIAATARVVDGFTTSQTDHSGITGSFTRAYTSTGITHTATDGRGNTTTTHTDLAGRTISSTDAADNTTTTVYDAAFDLPSVITNAQGKTACYKYDLRGRKVAEWGTAIQPALFGYDDADNLTALTTFRADSGDITTDPSGRTDGDTTTWAYHPTAGVELCKTYADNSQVVKTYDAFNRLATETNARGQVATHSYDAATGLPVSSFYNDGSSARLYTYNILGQLVQVMDAAGLRHYSYNSYGQLTQESVVNYESGSEQVHTRSETYDALGRCCGYTLCTSKNDTQVVSIGYATDGRISAAGFMHGGVNRQFSYGYLSGSNLLHTLTQPNGITLTQSYEEHRDLLTGMQYHRGSTLVVGRSYSYDTLGRPTNRSTARQGSVKNDTFTHNDRSELTAATLGTDAYNYSYDNIGNRKTAQEAAEEATAYDANNLNQYTAIQEGTAEAFVPTFDADGNQTKVKTSTGIWDVSYNILNRPTSFVRTNADGTQTKITAAYDTHGRRVWKKVEEISADGTTATVTSHRLFLYRGYLQIASLDLTRSTLPAEHFILWDPTEEVATRPLAIQKNGTWYTYGRDLTKNICEVFGADGYIKTAYTYTPYGAVTANGNVTQPIQWSSEYNDSELGLVYYNYRHYNPADGRWTGRDPKFSERNHEYVFCDGDPFALIDHLGLKVIGESERPCMESLIQNYYGYKRYESEEVYKGSGGQLAPLVQGPDKKLYANSCALRVCQALNGTQQTIRRIAKIPAARFIKDKNERLNLLGAEELQQYFISVYGKPDKKFEAGCDWGKKVQHRCAVVFYVNHVGNATHVGLLKDGKPWDDPYGRTVRAVSVWFFPCVCRGKSPCEKCSKIFEEQRRRRERIESIKRTFSSDGSEQNWKYGVWTRAGIL